MLLSTCKKIGIFSIGKIKPDNKMVGNINANIEITIAVCWLELTVEIKIPSDNASKVNNMVISNNIIVLPWIGTLKTNLPSNKIDIPLTKDSTKYGVTFPKITWIGFQVLSRVL